MTLEPVEIKFLSGYMRFLVKQGLPKEMDVFVVDMVQRLEAGTPVSDQQLKFLFDTSEKLVLSLDQALKIGQENLDVAAKVRAATLMKTYASIYEKVTNESEQRQQSAAGNGIRNDAEASGRPEQIGEDGHDHALHPDGSDRAAAGADSYSSDGSES